MRFLITGAAGFLGATVARALVSRGEETHGIVRSTTPRTRLEGLAPRLVVHEVDLRDGAGLRGVIERVRPDVVIHTAAKLGHPGTGTERIEAWGDGLLGTVSLVEALRGFPLHRLLHVCSSTVFRDSDRPHTENDPLEPRTARGATKAAALLAVRQWAAETGVPLTVGRPFSVYGPDEPRGRLVPELMHALRHDAPFSLTTADPRRDFVHADDVTAGLLLAAECEEAAGLDFNLGSGIETSTRELVALAEQVTGRSLRIDPAPFPERPSDRAHWSADISQAQKVLGWAPAIDLREGLADLWART